MNTQELLTLDNGDRFNSPEASYSVREKTIEGNQNSLKVQPRTLFEKLTCTNHESRECESPKILLTDTAHDRRLNLLDVPLFLSRPSLLKKNGDRTLSALEQILDSNFRIEKTAAYKPLETCVLEPSKIQNSRTTRRPSMQNHMSRAS